MPFPLGKRTSSIQTQSASRLGRGGGGLNRTISLPADDDPLPIAAGRRSNGGAQFNLDDSELPFPATSGQKLKFKHGQRLKVSWGRVSRKLAAGKFMFCFFPAVVFSDHHAGVYVQPSELIVYATQAPHPAHPSQAHTTTIAQTVLLLDCPISPAITSVARNVAIVEPRVMAVTLVVLKVVMILMENAQKMMMR
jgi:hypothetical protein